MSYCLIFEIRKVMDLCIYACACVCVCVDAVSEKGLFCEAIQHSARYFYRENMSNTNNPTWV